MAVLPVSLAVLQSVSEYERALRHFPVPPFAAQDGAARVPELAAAVKSAIVEFTLVYYA